MKNLILALTMFSSLSSFAAKETTWQEHLDCYVEKEMTPSYVFGKVQSEDVNDRSIEVLRLWNQSLESVDSSSCEVSGDQILCWFGKHHMEIDISKAIHRGMTHRMVIYQASRTLIAPPGSLTQEVSCLVRF